MPRKQYTHHFIYKTICIITNRFYIGMHSTSDMNDGYIGSGKRLWLSIKKYGKENHTIEILEFLHDRESLKCRESEIINEDLLKNPLCMNLSLGGGSQILFGEANGFYKRKRSPEHILAMKIGFDLKMKNPDNITKAIEKRSVTMIEKYGKLISKNFEGLSHSDETKRKIGESNSAKQKGNNNSQFGTCWITKDSQNLKIKNDQLEYYINLGWFKGRKY